MTYYQDPSSKIRPEFMGLYGMKPQPMDPRYDTPQLGRPNPMGNIQGMMGAKRRGKKGKQFGYSYTNPFGGNFQGPITDRFHQIVQQVLGGF